MKVSPGNLRRNFIRTVSAIALTATLLWMITIPADIVALLVVLLAAVILQCIVEILVRPSRTGVADEMRTDPTDYDPATPSRPRL